MFGLRQGVGDRNADMRTAGAGFLVADAPYVTGQIIAVDGGRGVVI